VLSLAVAPMQLDSQDQAVGASKPAAASVPASPIRFTFHPIDFKLESDETPERHAPETMAGGVAVFDYNNDGKLDIFFTNGADIKTLHKNSAKYSNRLFENDGHGHFKDITHLYAHAGDCHPAALALSVAVLCRLAVGLGDELVSAFDLPLRNVDPGGTAGCARKTGGIQH